MRGRRGLWVVGAAAAAIGAAVGVHASSASPGGVGVGAGTTNATYSCLVGEQRSVNVYGSVTLPPQDGRKQPGLLVVTTGAKTSTKNGVTTTVSQVGVGAKKHGLKIDTSSCTRVKHQISLKPKGLGSPTTATRNLFGHITADCSARSRVLVRLLLTTKAGVPAHALLAVRNTDAKRRPLAFYEWTPSKVTAYSAASCSQTQ
jgi:hypothetical protein